MFISVNMEPETRDAAIAALNALRAELEAKGRSGQGGFVGMAPRDDYVSLTDELVFSKRLFDRRGLWQ